ncbi:MAG: malonic semialdehyde reductase [Rhodospirillaceae bacterium]|nr:malonic semialdehyde reductase [Rhodospirillaceae bacterium]
MPRSALDDTGLDLLFRDARTQNSWPPEPVSDDTLHKIFDLLKMAPTSANCSPARFVFVATPEGKEKLRLALPAGNLDKTMSAPVTVIIAHDMRFYEHLPELFPHTDAKAWFTGNDDLVTETALRNGTLQGGYLMMAARSLGLDCGPMSGFDVDMVNTTFFPDGRFKVNFLCNIGYGDDKSVHPRGPRFDFHQACEVI